MSELLRVAVDANALLGQRTGVGTYVAELLAALAGMDTAPRVQASVIARAGAGPIRAQVPRGIPVHFVPLPARLARAAWRWTPTLAAFADGVLGDVDVFHATNFVAPPTRRRATVVTVHDLSYLRYPDTVHRSSLAYREHVARAVRDGAVICTVSHTVAAELRQAYPLPAERLQVTPLGVHPAWFAARADPSANLRLGVTGDYHLAVATREPRKNLGLLLEAYRLAARRGRRLPPLALVGGSGWGVDLDYSAIPDRQLLRLGFVSLDQLRGLVAGARRLLFPSIYEGFGLPPLEALACGVPVVAADIPVCREVLGDQARFVDPQDVEGWVDTLAGDDDASTPTLRRAQAARYTWDECARLTVAAYRQAVRAAT